MGDLRPYRELLQGHHTHISETNKGGDYETFIALVQCFCFVLFFQPKQNRYLFSMSPLKHITLEVLPQGQDFKNIKFYYLSMDK